MKIPKISKNISINNLVLFDVDNKIYTSFTSKLNMSKTRHQKKGDIDLWLSFWLKMCVSFHFFIEPGKWFN